MERAKGGDQVNPEMIRAATGATARIVSPMQFCHTRPEKSTVIDEIPARLVFSLENPRLSPVDQTGVLRVIDRLVRLKVDLRLLRGARHG